MHSKPVSEGTHKRWLGAVAIDNYLVLADPELNQMLVE